MTASLARLLPDFELSRIGAFQASRHEHSGLADAAAPAVDVDAIRAQARIETEARVRAEMTQRFDSERQAEAERHVAELETMRAQLDASAAQSIAEAVAARSTEIADLIAADVEAVLAPLVDEAIRARILAGLAREVRDCLALENAGRISVSGPEGLVSALRDAIGPAADRLAVRDADGFDIEVEVDRTRFATRLSAWAEAVAESLS